MIGELSALATAILWSGTALVFSEASKRVGSTQVNVLRLFLAMLFLLLTLWALGIPMRLSSSQALLLAGSGLIGLVGVRRRFTK